MSLPEKLEQKEIEECRIITVWFVVMTELKLHGIKGVIRQC